MIDEDWRAAWNVYESACQLPTGERRAFVESELSDPALRQRVMSLLERDDRSGSETASDHSLPVTMIGTASDSTNSKIDDWPQLGKKIGRFEVTAPLGRGGMGEIYAARDQELARTVAMKFISSRSIGTAGVERLIREAKSASALNHPGIVTVHEVIHCESSLAIVMEMVEGKSFRALCEKPNAIEKVADWGRQMAQALAVAHTLHIVHRDIKPENLMLRDDNLVKILDFGIARDITDPDELDAIPLGTLGYMAPEQIGCAKVTSAADVFSLGVVLFELTSGKHPFLAQTASETTKAIALLDAGPLPVPHSPRLGQRDLDALVRSMLVKDPSRRPEAGAVAAQLGQIARRLESGMRRRFLLVAIPVVAAALGAVIWRPSVHPESSAQSHPRITRFTTLEGTEELPSFSPDGQKIVFAWGGHDGSNRDIYVQNVQMQDATDETPVRLTTNPAEDSSPAWSPDGRQIAFLRRVRGENSYRVIIVPAGGGPERAVGRIEELEYFHRVLAWWPDGRSLIVRDESAGTVGFVRLNLETGNKLPLTTPSGVTDRDSDVSVSPDGSRFAFLRRLGGTNHDSVCIYAFSNQKLECSPTDLHPTCLTWWRQGKELLYATADAIWRMPLDGSPSPTKRLSGAFADISSDRATRRLVFSRGNVDINLWQVRRRGEGRKKLIASTTEESDAQYSPDGERIVFRSNRSGSYELWVAAKDGSRPTRITNLKGRLGSARWSPDGKNIAFDGYNSPVQPTNNTNVFVVSASGGPVRRLTDDKALYFVPNWSRDGRWVYCVKQTGTRWETWKVPFEAGQAVPVSSTGMFDIVESSDGNFYYTTQRGAPGIWSMPVEGGKATLVPGTEKVSLFRYWQLSPMGLYFAEGPSNPVVQFLNLNTGARTRLASLGTHLRKGPRGLAVSPDGSLFLYMQEDDPQSDLYLMDGLE